MGEETGQVRNILEPSHETDILQSFVRVDLGDESEAEAVAEIKKKLEQIQYQQKQNLIINEDKTDRAARRDSEDAPINKTTFNQLAKDMKLDGIQKRKARTGQGECYTDKDRAAAFNMGSKDIKQSLKIKQREDRSKSLINQEDVDPASVLALGYHELRSGNVSIAVSYINKALELNPDDRNALVARSKCYLLLGQPKMALEDAETALISDKNYIKAIFQKAEALYHLGDFEHSLMYYHRGLRIRPELAGFRLGVQKTQEAIENTIGVAARPVKRNSASKKYTMGITLDEKGIEISPSTRSRPKTSNSRNRMDAEKRNSKRLLGELHLDKEYLENLLVHPDIKCLFKDKEDITGHAKEAIEFLNGRQEFWRQQRPTVAPKKKTRTKSQARSVSAHPHSRLQRPQ